MGERLLGWVLSAKLTGTALSRGPVLGESCQVSTINVQGGSGNKACLRTGKESDHCGDLVGVPQSLERYKIFNRDGMGAICGVHIGFSGAWLNGVDGDSPGSEINGQTPCQNRNCRLGHRIDATAGKSGSICCDASDHNDAAAFLHMPGSDLGADKDGTHVNRNHSVEVLQRESVDRASKQNARVVNQDIQTTKGC